MSVWMPDIPGTGYPVKRTQRWEGMLRQTSASQFEVRQQQQSAPRWEWDIPVNYLRSWRGFAEWQQLMGFYGAQFGGLLSFYYRDSQDNSTTAEPIGTGDGATTAFQLQRDLNGMIEPIYVVDTRGSAMYGPYTRPAALTPVAYAGGVVKPATFNPDTGIVTYTTAPVGGAALTADFSYGFRVSFEDDKIDFDQLMNGLYEARSIKLLQQKT
jgi:uncharacterized protein (TIGR02217 family)